MIPTAKEMAEAIWGNTQKLLEIGILDPKSAEAANRLRSKLISKGTSTDWEISVAREAGFIFQQCITDNAVIFQPVISVDRIATQASNLELFSCFDISLDITCAEGKNHARWHFDLANVVDEHRFQDGPKFHMQFGGNVPGRESFWLNRPRWIHAPMDLILLLEVVAANFFTDKWDSHLRQDPSWCENVSQSEKLCLSNYVQNLQRVVNNRSQTVLGEFWANAA